MDQGKRVPDCAHVLSGLPLYIPVIMGLKDQLRGIIPDHSLCYLSDRFDVIGSIAVLCLPPALSDYKAEIAHAILSRRKNIKTVINKTSRLGGSNRTGRYEILAGQSTITIHHEYDFAYKLDVGTVFFNPRLASERKRVTMQVQHGERVLVPCCGVGPFVVPAAARGAEIVAIEQNPEACRWLVENLMLNGIKDRVTIVQGDAFDTSLLPNYDFDRAIIPTPYGMDAIFEVIAPDVKQGGMIHFYTFRNRNQADALNAEFGETGFEVVIQRRCGNVAPGVSRWVYDLVKRK
jgi:tRNA (guanine37-N1)-methyltransferase